MDSFGFKLKKIFKQATKNLNFTFKKYKSNSVFIENKLIGEIFKSFIDIDIDPSTIKKIIKPIQEKMGTKITKTEIKHILFQQINGIIKPLSFPIEIDQNNAPHKIMVCGINGSGKTSSIIKMCHMLTALGWRITIASADKTKRSAITILHKKLSDNPDVNIINKSDITNMEKISIPLLIDRAKTSAKDHESDLLIIDTAGCINEADISNNNLKEIAQELKPTNIVTILDSTHGIKALDIIDSYSRHINVNGVVLTKIDQTKKSGLIVSIANLKKLPIHGISIGENLDDLQDFYSEEFADTIVENI